MKIILNSFIALLLIVSSHISYADITIEEVTWQGGEGYFNCSFKGKQATKKCHVKKSIELVTERGLVTFYGNPDGKSKHVKMEVLNIAWPDKTRSRFAWGDSVEIYNLQSEYTGGYAVKFAEWPEIDYSNGFVILDENNKEYIRLW